MMPVDGKELDFILIKIPAGDVQKRCFVLEQNARLQEALNEVSLNDILPTIQEKGQQYPAIGYIDETGKIEVWEGSRRRMACILANQSYYIWVTREEVSIEAKQFMSDVGNVRKSLSLYERGAIWETMLAEGKYSEAKHLAEGEHVDEAVVTTARKAFALPEDIVKKLPAINDLGRPSINKLAGVIKRIEPQQIATILGELKTVDLGTLIEETGVRDGKRLNKAFLEKFFALCPAPPAKKEKKKSDIEDQQDIALMAIPEGLSRIPVASSGKTSVHMAEEGKGDDITALIELSNVSNALLEEITAFIYKKVEG